MLMGAKGDTHYRGSAVLVAPFLNFSVAFFSLFPEKKTWGVTVCLAVFAGSQNICVESPRRKLVRRVMESSRTFLFNTDHYE